MWCPCGMTSFCSRIFYSLFSSSMINVVTIPSDVTDVTVWLITSNPNPQVLKIEKWKINWKENKKRLSPLSVILTLFTSYLFQLWLCLELWPLLYSVFHPYLFWPTDNSCSLIYTPQTLLVQITFLLSILNVLTGLS